MVVLKSLSNKTPRAQTDKTGQDQAKVRNSHETNCNLPSFCFSYCAVSRDTGVLSCHDWASNRFSCYNDFRHFIDVFFLHADTVLIEYSCFVE